MRKFFRHWQCYCALKQGDFKTQINENIADDCFYVLHLFIVRHFFFTRE
jgi:hypothetical protein